MSNLLRKVRRNKLKNQMGNNKINDYFHTQYDSLEKRLKRGIKNAQK
jgi:hypothetical protein